MGSGGEPAGKLAALLGPGGFLLKSLKPLTAGAAGLVRQGAAAAVAASCCRCQWMLLAWAAEVQVTGSLANLQQKSQAVDSLIGLDRRLPPTVQTLPVSCEDYVAAQDVLHAPLHWRCLMLQAGVAVRMQQRKPLLRRDADNLPAVVTCCRTGWAVRTCCLGCVLSRLRANG